MMTWKISSLLFLFLIINLHSSAQIGVYMLHPSVGDTINRTEKLDYSIFPKTKNPNFKEAFITMRNDSFLLNAMYVDDFLTERYLPKEEIIEAQKGIEKINAYYRLLADSNNVNYQDNNYSTDRIKIEMNGALGEKAKKEARMYQRLQDDQRRASEVGRGNNNQELRIEFK